MRRAFKSVAVLVSCGLLCWSSGRAADKAAKGGAIRKPDTRMPGVLTNFVKGASLTTRELGQVLMLAEQCGIAEPGEVSTMYFLPGGGRGIHVKSVDRTSGRDIAVDELMIGKVGWTDMIPAKDAKWVGKLWAGPSYKYTRHLRVYDFRGERIRVEISGGVSADVADKAIPLIAARKVRFPPKEGAFDNQRREMEKMLAAKPTALSKQDDGTLWLRVEGTMDALQMRFEKGEVVLEHVITIHV